jgi:hypothetical protein
MKKDLYITHENNYYFVHDKEPHPTKQEKRIFFTCPRSTKFWTVSPMFIEVLGISIGNMQCKKITIEISE